MRMRKKPFARPELESWAYFIVKPPELKGCWRAQFENPDALLYVELGCGKGSFIGELSAREPAHNFLAIDIKDEMLVLTKRNIEKRRAPDTPHNVRIMAWNIEKLEEMLAPEEAVDGIYINFCNPWPKAKHKKHRLTYPKQLEMYARHMKPGAVLQFKTDDEELYRDTKRYLHEQHWEVLFDSSDFAVSAFENNIMTEHERMFMEQGKPIKGIIARPMREVQP